MENGPVYLNRSFVTIFFENYLRFASATYDLELKNFPPMPHIKGQTWKMLISTRHFLFIRISHLYRI